MIARIRLAAHRTIHARRREPLRQIGAEQQVVEPQARVARPAVPHVVPVGVDAVVRMQRADRIGPALGEQPLEGGAAFRLHQRVLVVGVRVIDVERRRHHIVVAGEHDRHAFVEQRLRMPAQPFEPGELVGEFRPGLRIAVRRVEAADQDAADGRLDVAALRVLRVAGQLAARAHRRPAARQDRHPVPRLLAAPDCVVAGAADRGNGKIGVGGFELLQARHVGRGRAQPGEQVGEPVVDVVDVEGRDLQASPFHRIALIRVLERERLLEPRPRLDALPPVGDARPPVG